MAYEKQTWVDGDKTKPLSAARLNHIEDGIASIPTEPQFTAEEVTELKKLLSPVGE